MNLLFKRFATTTTLLFVSVFCMFFASFVQANTLQSQITKTVVDFIKHQLPKSTDSDLEIKLAPLDKRLKLADCSQALEAFLPLNSNLFGKTTLGVRCRGDKPWSIYAPTEINIYKYIVVSNRPISRGSTIDINDLMLQKRNISRLRKAYYERYEDVVGKIAKRSIGSQKSLSARLLDVPKIIKRGQEVILLATTNTLKIRMQGKALNDGAKGDVIRVRNLKSKRVVEGIVHRAGIVKVKM